jgi:hypothetical protein
MRKGKAVPIWVIIVSLASIVSVLVGAFLVYSPGGDQETLTRLRQKPGGSAATPTGSYGMPRGAPIQPVSQGSSGLSRTRRARPESP